MKAFLQLTVGTLLLCVYEAGTGIAAAHRPACVSAGPSNGGLGGICSGWPQGRYDAVHIGSRGFLVIGLVFLAVGLISYARRSPSTRASRSTTS